MLEDYVIMLDKDLAAHPGVLKVRASFKRLKDAKAETQVGDALWILPAEAYGHQRRTTQEYVHRRDGTLHQGGVFKLD